MDDGCVLKFARQLVTAGFVLVNNCAGDTALLQKTEKVIADCAAAYDEGVLDRLKLEVNLVEEVLRLLGCGDNRDNVLLLEDEITVCNICVIATLDSAEGNAALKLHGNVSYRHSCKAAALGNLEGQKLNSALCENINLNGRGEVDNSCNLLRRRKLGVNDHCKTKLVFNIGCVVGIFGIFKSGNGATACRLLRNDTAEQVKLVVACHGDEKIGLVNSGLLLHGTGCAVTDDAHDVIFVCDSLNLCSVLVDDGYVVARPVQLLCKGFTNLATAYDNYIHSEYLRLKSILLQIHYNSKILLCQVKKK